MMNDGKYRILIAEDDDDIRGLLKLYLENNGFEVLLAKDGREAIKLAENEKPDLALLDIMMPGADGYRVMKEIRKSSNLPVLFLTAKDQDYDKVLGLNLGADGYLTKPFNPLEVTAYIQSSLRRFYQLGSGKKETFSQILEVGDLRLDLEQMRLEKGGEEIELTPTEFKILSRLMKTPGRVFTKAQLYESISGGFSESDDKTMMVHISNLREKIEEDGKNPQYIKTVRGLGYKIEYKK